MKAKAVTKAKTVTKPKAATQPKAVTQPKAATQPKVVAAHIGIGHHYLSNGEFDHAARAYSGALISLYDSSDMSDLRELDGVSNINAKVPGMDGKPRALAGLQSPVHDALVSAYGREILEGLNHFVGFNFPRTKYWVVAYHTCTQLVLDDCLVPRGRPQVFTLVSTKTGIAAWRVPDIVCAQLSYLLAHIAWAGIEEVSRLYVQHQIMIDSGVPALLTTAKLLHCAIALRPKNAWAHARLGETYRRIANGWPGFGASNFEPESRVRDYVFALLHYQEALSLAPDAPGAFWVHAHLGAATVNVRAFAGVIHKAKSPALDALLAAWFPDSNPDDAYRLFTRKGQSSLVEAQRGAGNYYPWAEIYYSGTLYLEGLECDPKEAAHAVELLSLAWVNLIQGLHLQPSLSRSEMEPGELYVNAFLQISLFNFWLKDFIRAWVIARSGMSRLFAFEFLPGVQMLQGFQLLINISAEMQRGEHPVKPPRKRILELLNAEVGRDFSVGGVGIPERPIVHRKALVDFIEEVMVNIGEPTIAPVMPDGIKLDTGIKMGLLQAYYVFNYFQEILDELGGDTARVSECIGEITVKLGLKPRGTAYPAKHHKHDLFGVCMTGKLTYRMAADFKLMTDASNEG